MFKLFETIAAALNFLHNERKMCHGDLCSDKIIKIEQGEYRLLPPRIKPR